MSDGRPSDPHSCVTTHQLEDDLARMRAHADRLAEACGLFLWHYSDLDEVFSEPDRQSTAAKVIAAVRTALAAYRGG